MGTTVLSLGAVRRVVLPLRVFRVAQYISD